MHIAAVSETSCMVQVGDAISPEISAIVGQLTRLIKNQLGRALIDHVPSYNSILLTLDIDILTVEDCCQQLSPLLNAPLANHQQFAPQRFEIPTYYGDEVALDMAEVSVRTGLSRNEIIQLHSEAIYRVYAIGFAPGFCFLGQLNPQLHIRRKATPRQHVPTGSVAIAEQQTAVYPCPTPGGWHIIGRSSQDMLRLCSALQTPLKVGDEIRFIAVDRARYESQRGLLA